MHWFAFKHPECSSLVVNQASTNVSSIYWYVKTLEEAASKEIIWYLAVLDDVNVIADLGKEEGNPNISIAYAV